MRRPTDNLKTAAQLHQELAYHRRRLAETRSPDRQQRATRAIARLLDEARRLDPTSRAPR